MTLEAEEFIRRFLLHVLPEGLQRIRYLYLAPINTLSFLSRPKGRNFRAEELGRGRWETASPEGR
jgi:hypothetical protein